MDEWLSYDQISLIPAHVSTLTHRAEADTSVQFGPVKLTVPIIAAPMSDVCGNEMAVALRKAGALGLTHRLQPMEYRIHVSEWGTALGVAISLKEKQYDIDSAYGHGVRILCIDTANGASVMVEKAVKNLKDKYPDIFIITGNVASAETFYQLEDWGVDAIRVGIAGGSVCETRTETGVYSPMASVILDILNQGRQWQPGRFDPVSKIQLFRRPKDRKALLIADGGIKSPSDMCKALALGADVVMMGGALAGTKESPGEVLKIEGKLYKKLRGAASFSTQKESKGEEPDYVEGAETLVPYRGSVEKVISRFAAGLRSSMSYMNARNLTEYRSNVKIVRVK